MKSRPYVRKQYWNEPTMAGTSALPAGDPARLAITSGVFLRNMFKWITGRKGALTTYYPRKRAGLCRRQPRLSTS